MKSSAHRSLVFLAFSWSLVTLGWWALAFYPVGDSSAAWIAAAQSVCFGTLPNGLPDSYGWILLIGMPAGLGSAMILTYSAEYLDLLKSSRSFLGLVLLLAAAFFAEAAWVQGRLRAGLALDNIDFSPVLAGPLPADYPLTRRPLPDFKLKDHRGKLFEKKDLVGKAGFLTFTFGSCTTICPVLVHDTREALKQLGPNRARAFYITLDPWRDKTSRLAGLAESWNLPAQASLLGGEVDEVNRVLDLLNIPRKRDELTGQLDHPALVYVINPAGEIAYTFNNPPVEWLVEAARRLNHSKL